MTATVPATRPSPACLDPAVLALPFFEPRHRDLAARVSGWCVDNRDLWRHPDGHRPPERGRQLLRALGDAGLLGLHDPATDASDGDLRSLCLAREALAYADDLADYAFSIQVLAATPLLRHGSAEQRQRHLPGLATGAVAAAFAISEPEAGSDVASVATTARREGDGSFVLNGTKAWIANATIAGLFLVLARTGEGPGALGLSMLLVPADAPGVRVEPVDLIAPRAFGHVHLHDVRVPPGSLIGRPGRGFPIAIDVLDRFRMTVGAAALGFARRAAAATLAHCRRRRIYGGPLVELPTVRAALADIDVKLNAAALLVARAAWEADHGTARWAKHSSIAKLYSTEAAGEVVDACVQLFGAAGLVAGSLPERLYRQIRSLRIYEGASDIQRAVIAGSLDARRAEACHDLFEH
jgi:acyl-CoA dehydrogenase